MTAVAQIASAASAGRLLDGSEAAGRNARATARRIAASPALKRKNFTPASRETNTSVNTMPTPRCARNRNRTVERDMRRSPYADLPSLEPFVHLGPVDDVPPCADVVGTAILIFQVVRVLPDIDAEDRFL